MSSERHDDLVTDWLREMDTARTPVDAEPPASLMALGERLQREQSAAQDAARRRVRVRQRRVRLTWAASLASLLVVAAVAVSSVLLTPSAEAATPTPLTFHSPAAEHQVISDAIAQLSKPGGISEPERTVRTVSWAISIEDGELEAPVVAEVIELDWNPDLSGRSSIVLGRTEDPVNGQVGRVVPTGRKISLQTFAAGEFGVPSPDSPPPSAAGVAELLTLFGMPEHPSPGQLVESMVTVMDYWTLSDAQEAVLLEMIQSSGHAHSLGTSVDRLGRPVSGLQVDSSSTGLTHTVLISTKTGRIAGVETQRTAPDKTIPAGTVVEYRMWNPQKGEEG